MTDVIDKLRIEAQKEPHEPIWRDAMGEIQNLRIRVEALELLFKMRELPQQRDSCQWKADEAGSWRSDCGYTLAFTVDGPTENQFRFCPYCGGKISIHEAKNDL